MNSRLTARRTEPKPNRRQIILDVAAELLTREGLGEVTTRQIAAKVGISQPSLYAHFHSIHEIHEELCANAFSVLDARMRRVIDAAPQSRDLLRALIDEYIEFGLQNPVAYRLAFIADYPQKHEMSEIEYNELDHPGPRVFGHLLTSVVQVRADLPQEDRLLLCKVLWATLHGLVSLLITRPGFPWGDRRTLIEAQSVHARKLIDMFGS